MSADNACPSAQQILSDCPICCLPAWDASSDATDEGLEAGLDARSDADASSRDGSGDGSMPEGGDGPVDASALDATPDDAADTGSEPSED